jgi:hypothetical protein
MPPKRITDDGAPKARKPRAPKERPPGMTNAAWAADMERRQTETRGRAEREKKLAAKRAAAADEQARRSPIVRLATPTSRPRYALLAFSVDIGWPSCDDAGFSVQMRRAFDMYGDDSDGQHFKYLNVFARIEDCEKWAEVRRTLSKNKDE